MNVSGNEQNRRTKVVKDEWDVDNNHDIKHDHKDHDKFNQDSSKTNPIDMARAIYRDFDGFKRGSDKSNPDVRNSNKRRENNTWQNNQKTRFFRKFILLVRRIWFLIS